MMTSPGASVLKSHLLIVRVGRSGTKLLAGLLNGLGLDKDLAHEIRHIIMWQMLDLKKCLSSLPRCRMF